MTRSDDHNVALRSFKPATGEVLRWRGRYRQLGMGQRMRLPPVELGNALRWHAPGLKVRADTERSDKGHFPPRQFPNRRVVKVIVVIVRDENQRPGVVTRAAQSGTGWKRSDPQAEKAKRALPTPGRATRADHRPRSARLNDRARWPAVPCPAPWPTAHVGSTDGSGARGTRRSPPQRNSRHRRRGGAVGSRNSGNTGWTLRNASPAQSGETLMRSRRRP